MKLVTLDRDGTINYDRDEHIKSPAEWRPLEGSLEAIARLTQDGYRIVVATNQSGIARGFFDTATLVAIHDTMNRAVAQAGGRIDAVFFCPHAQDSNCGCRKPQPGMLIEIGRRFNVSLQDVCMVGDQPRDLGAAAAAGAPQVLVLKRELLWIPFFGWGLALMSPIAIDRSRGIAALRSIARRGRERLEQGFWVVVFPEGTRVAPGERRDYHVGGAWLAAASGAPIVPVAHNAGLVWPRNAFIKRPGTVTVRIGPAIDTANRDPKIVNQLAESWIEEQQKALC